MQMMGMAARLFALYEVEPLHVALFILCVDANRQALAGSVFVVVHHCDMVAWVFRLLFQPMACSYVAGRQ